jgi:hypothetical protein
MTKNQVIVFGVAAAVLSQYIWLFPLAYGGLVCSVVAIFCGIVSIVWAIVDYAKTPKNPKAQ